MKKIDKDTIKFLTDAVETANSVSILNMVIDEDGLRGMDDGRLVVMLKPVIDIDLPFESLALGDVARFAQRLNIHNDNGGSSIEMDQNPSGGVISLKFKSKNLNIEYRCVKSTIFEKRIPKRVNDEPMGAISLNDEAIKMLKNGSVTMKSETVMFYKPKNITDVQMVMKDELKSEFTFDLDAPFAYDEDIDEGDDVTFANNYPIKTLLAALKDADNNELVIGVNGSMTIKKNNIDIIIPRRV